MFARLGPFGKGAAGALAVLAATALLAWVVFVTLWAWHGQQTFEFVNRQLQTQAQQAAPAAPAKEAPK